MTLLTLFTLLQKDHDDLQLWFGFSHVPINGPSWLSELPLSKSLHLGPLRILWASTFDCTHSNGSNDPDLPIVLKQLLGSDIPLLPTYGSDFLSVFFPIFDDQHLRIPSNVLSLTRVAFVLLTNQVLTLFTLWETLAWWITSTSSTSHYSRKELLGPETNQQLRSCHTHFPIDDPCSFSEFPPSKLHYNPMF